MLIALAAGVFVYGSSCDDPEPKPKADAVQLASDTFDAAAGRVQLWDAKPNPEAVGDEANSSPGLWLYGGTLVVGNQRDVAAYDLKTGQLKWSAHPPESGLLPCTMSAEVSRVGTGAILYTSGGDTSDSSACDWIQVVDVRTGAEKWSAKLDVESSTRSKTSVMVNDEQAVAMTDHLVAAFDVDNGKQQWSKPTQQPDCYLYGKGEDTTLLLLDICSTREQGNGMLAVDTRDGDIIWKRTFGDAPNLKSAVLSVNPAVLRLKYGSSALRGYIVCFDEKGKSLGEIAQPQPFGMILDKDTSTEQYLIKDRTMVTTVYKNPLDPNEGGTLVAFDLTSGAKLWNSDFEGSKSIRLVGIAGESVIAIQKGEIATVPSRLLSYRLPSGSMTPGGKLPDQDSNSYREQTVRMFGGLLVSVELHVDGENNPWVTLYAPSA